jgi:hypothetical protein
MLGRREITPPGRVQVPQRSPTMTGSHNTNQKENGGGHQKRYVRTNIVENTKVKENFMKELHTE